MSERERSMYDVWQELQRGETPREAGQVIDDTPASEAKSLADVLGVLDPQQPVSLQQDAKPFVKMTAKAFSQEILNSRQYRESLLRRIIFDELPPAVECKLMDHAWGRPVEKVQVEDTTPRFEELSIEELEQRAMMLVEMARLMREQQGESNTNSEATEPTSVH